MSKTQLCSYFCSIVHGLQDRLSFYWFKLNRRFYLSKQCEMPMTAVYDAAGYLAPSECVNRQKLESQVQGKKSKSPNKFYISMLRG